MNSFWTKFAIIAIIFVAEAACIYGEMLAAKHYVSVSESFWRVFFKVFAFMVIFSGLIVVGYMWGLKSFKNIWVVSVISITSILIVEPILAYSLFKEFPTKGALTGLILGAVGFVITLIWK